ncbi:MAG: hypothetical protein RBQ71_04075 [Acholeplasmataceae bacterium]|jgi:hypothetical protein|nr:hypothetical protein [Acholeplasmataceae bacterium]
MEYKVIYFTRTGHSKRVAEKIAKALDANLIEIDDHKNWKGFFGYLRAGYYSMSNKQVEITLNNTLDSNQHMNVVAPLWAGGVAPAVRTFLRMNERNQIHLLVTSMGSTIKDRTGYLSVTDIIKKFDNEDEKIQVFLKDSLGITQG